MRKIFQKVKKKFTKFSLKAIEQSPVREFDLQIKLMNFLGIFEQSSTNWKIFSLIITTLNALMNIYSAFTIALYIIFLNYDEILEIAVSFSLLITTCMGLVKYFTIIFNYENIFNLIADIRRLNKKYGLKINFYFFTII